MPTTLLDGRRVANQLISHVRQSVSARGQAGLRPPALAVIKVGDDPASALYVRNKKRACEQAGIVSISHDLPAEIAESALLALIDQLNADSNVDGLLIQLPLPPQINPLAVIEHIDPHKDVDGFHPYNIGRLAIKSPLMRPCTPRGVMTLLAEYGVNLAGQHALIVGASNIVGRPQALELLLARATVTVCHSATRNLAQLISTADILVSAVGKPHFVKGEWIKPGAVVIDVGINRLGDGRLCGDVEFDIACTRARLITPVPGGVGPMTVASLLQNTLEAAEHLSKVS